MSIQLFQYNGSPIQFEEVNGQIMANATLMAAAFNKKPDDIFKTKSWKEFENELINDLELRFEDIRTVKNGDSGGSWIHQELVIEFARRLKPAFAIWCNRKIAELLKTGKVEIKPLSQIQMLQQVVNAMVEQEASIQELKEDVKELKAKQVTSPQNYFAISGYASLYRINVDTNTAKKAGKQAAGICKELGYIMGSVPDAKYGSVKTYPVDVLDSVFKQMNLTR